jgi:hypothetical protein
MEMDSNARFYKSQLIKSGRFGKYADILNALLDEDKKYMADEARQIIRDFLNKEVH